MSGRLDFPDTPGSAGATIRSSRPGRSGRAGQVLRRPAQQDQANVVAATATMTVDLRNTDDGLLRQAEARLEWEGTP